MIEGYARGEYEGSLPREMLLIILLTAPNVFSRKG